jgi:hypothetical protein
MPEPAARVYLRDLPDARLHLLHDAGHTGHETHFETALPLVRLFLGTSCTDGNIDGSHRKVSMKECSMTTSATIARIWRGRTTRDRADAYEAYLLREGIPVLKDKALGVQVFREDGDTETEFLTISYWQDVSAMASFTGGKPDKVHHLPRDEEFLIELPERVSIMRILVNHLPRA